MHDKIKELVETLKVWDDAYHNGEEKVPDETYDAKKQELKEIDPNNPYFLEVGSDVRGGKIKLPYVMGSLDQIDENSYDSWLVKNNITTGGAVVTDKLDGISCMLAYRYGKFSIAYSRGNGLEGADITRHVKHIVPNQINTNNPPDKLFIRGELIMKNGTFRAKYSDKFSNPRSMVAGCMNRETTELDVLSDIDFIPYSIVDSDVDYLRLDQKSEITQFGSWGFDEIHYKMFEKTNEKVLKEHLKARLQNSIYELDGLVIRFSEIKRDSSSSSINPLDTFKYKVNSEENFKRTVVKKVEWKVGKSGKITPRIIFSPIDLFGTTVTKATAFNAKFCKDNNIKAGKEVLITKSGTVIPFIVKVIDDGNTGWDAPDEGTFGKWQWSETGVDAMVEGDTEDKVFYQVLDYFRSIDVDGFKEASVKKVIDSVGINSESFDDIVVTMNNMFDFEYSDILGKNGTKIHDSLKRRHENMSMDTFLGSIPHFGTGFGKRRAKELLTNLDRNEDFWSLKEGDIKSFFGFNDKTSKRIYDGIERAKVLKERLEIEFVENVTSSEMENITVVFTGFRDKNLQKKVEEMGGKVASSVSGKTSFVVAVDPSSNSGKVKKAKEKDVNVLGIEEFKDMFNL